MSLGPQLTDRPTPAGGSTDLQPLELLLALCRRGGSGVVAVTRHHGGSVGLDRRAVVVGADVHGWAGGVHEPAAVLCHGGNLRGPNTAGSQTSADQKLTWHFC